MKKYPSLTLLIVCLFFSVFILGCTKEKLGEVEKINNVVRILMHEPHKYTIMYRNGSNKEIESRIIMSHNIRLFEDVLVDQDKWVSFAPIVQRGGHTSDYENSRQVEIHIHSAEDIKGGEWDHGKFGKGQTLVVQ